MAQENDDPPPRRSAPQTPTHVAYLGPPASFSHQAAVDVFPHAVHRPLPTFEAIFAAVQESSRAAAQNGTPYDYNDHCCAVVPVENSTNGPVVPVQDLLRQCLTSGPPRRRRRGPGAAAAGIGIGIGIGIAARAGNDPEQEIRYPDVEAVSDYELSVHHYLYAHASASVPAQTAATAAATATADDDNTDLAAISTLYTHPQVWTQCTRFLTRHFPPASPTARVDTSSTSEAARLVALDAAGTSAALCSKLAGEMWGLRLLRGRIEDDEAGNRTRFVVLRNRRRGLGGGGGEGGGMVNDGRGLM